LGVKTTWDACRAYATKGLADRFVLGVLASSPEPLHRELVRAKLAEPESAVHALWALGFSGDLEAADLIVSFLDKAGRIAGESLSAITGVVLEGSLR
jgi:hypothetical protein